MTKNALRSKFPCFRDGNALQDLVYFDSAATTQKPESVLNCIQDYYLNQNANVHRASYGLASATTTQFEQARSKVQKFINAHSSNEIVWTKGATEAINMVAKTLTDTFTDKNVAQGTGRILISATEHHANIIPWQILAQKCDLAIDVIPVNELGVWDTNAALDLIGPDTKIVALGLVSNALGNINPIKPILQKAKAHGAMTLVDGAQAVSHMVVDVQDLQCDFFVFSGHKAFGPTGIGVLYGREAILTSLPVYLTGGEMVDKVDYQQSTFLPLPFKYEAGTPNIEGVIALGAAIDFIDSHRELIVQQESLLSAHLRSKLSQIPAVKLLGDEVNHIATVSFHVEGLDNFDLGTFLASNNIAIRVGHHCTMPLMKTLGISGTVRASLSCYNTIEEIDKFVVILKRAIEQLSGFPHESVESFELKTVKVLALASKVKAAKGWDGKFREIMLAGKHLARLSDEKKTTENLVHGCESELWLICHRKSDDYLEFEADSPSKMIRGLISLILEPINSEPASYIANYNFNAHLIEIGLEQHLSESRTNGLAQAIKTIKMKADTIVNKE